MSIEGQIVGIEGHDCGHKDHLPIAAGCCSELLIPKTIQTVLQSGFYGCTLRKVIVCAVHRTDSYATLRGTLSDNFRLRF